MKVGLYLATVDETPPADSPIYTELERAYCLRRRNPHPHLAGRYAAKRAACIALDLDESAVLGNVEVAREPGQAPTLRLHGDASKKMTANEKPHVSITHSGDYAVALVVAER